MMTADRDNGPPQKEASPSASQGARANQQVSHDTTTAPHDNRSGHRQPYDGLAGNARRFGASRRRAASLLPCGHIGDPHAACHRCSCEISDHMAEAAVAAVLHLDQLGTPGLLDDRTCRALSEHLGGCTRCNQWLVAPSSVRRHMGPVCRAKAAQ